MHKGTKDLTGMIFGQLKVIRYLGSTRVGNNTFATWECECACGAKVQRIGLGLIKTAKLGHESVCSLGCKFRTMVANKKTYIKVKERVGATTPVSFSS